MNYSISKLLTLSILSLTLLLPLTAVSAASTSNETLKNQIPVKMEPGTMLKYDEKNNPIITKNASKGISSITFQSKASNQLSGLNEFIDVEGRAAEDELFQSVAEEAKNSGLPSINLGYDLPEPTPGLVVIYGSDGQINRYYNELETAQSQGNISILSTVPSTTVKYPGRLTSGVYNYGTGQKITITSSAVTGEGRFTVYRPGVGGSGTVGSSGKTLEAGDVATKRQIDNPKHNTALTTRALDTDVVKTVFKNDIGTMPNSVLDVFFWGWDYSFYGYKYSDTLSFSGRYYYQF